MCPNMLINLRRQLQDIRRITRSSCCAVRAVHLLNKQISYFVNYYYTTIIQVLSLRKLLSELCSLSVSSNKSSDSLCKPIGKSVTYCNITACVYSSSKARCIHFPWANVKTQCTMCFWSQFLQSWLKEYPVYCR